MITSADFTKGMTSVWIDTQEKLEALIPFYKDEDELFVDFETSGLDPRLDSTWMFAINKRGESVVHVIDTFMLDMSPLKAILEGSTLVGANIGFDLKFLRTLGIRPRRVFDVIVMGRMLTCGKITGYKKNWDPIPVKNALTDLSDRYLGFHLDKSVRERFITHRQLVDIQRKSGRSPSWSKEEIDYAARDVFVLPDIKDLILQDIEEEGLEKIAYIENRLVPVVADMEWEGVYIDEKLWMEIVEHAEEQMKVLYGEMCEYFKGSANQMSMFEDITGSKYDINLESQQVVKDGFAKLGINLEKADKRNLKLVYHPAAKKLLNYRAQQKQQSTYGRNWIEKIHPITGRIHASFFQIGADSGRFSSNDPNVQNVPDNKFNKYPLGDARWIGEKDEYNILLPDHSYRHCFRAREGYKLLTADYAQVEMRIACEVANDENMRRIILAGGDLHSRTASLMFNVPLDECGKDSDYRKLGKTMNFAILYGLGDLALAEALGYDVISSAKEAKKSIEKARKVKKAYFDAFPDIRAYMATTRAMPEDRGYSTTILGRKRWYTIPDRSFMPEQIADAKLASIKNQGSNTPIQGCVMGTTRIFEKTHGYKEIQSLCNKQIEVWEGDSYAKCWVVYSGKKELVKITFADGRYIECSPEHKFLVRGCEGHESWRTPAELAKSKNFRVVLTEPVTGWDCQVMWPEVTKGNSWNAKATPVSGIGNDHDIGLFLGRIASAGSVRNHQTTLLVAEHEENILERLLEICKCLGHVTVATCTKNRKERMTSLTISSKSLVKQLVDCGLKHQIPEFVWSNPAMLSGYLCGMFDGDGHVSIDGAVLTFGKGSTHLKWARQIQEALSLFGVRARVRSYEDDRTVVQIKKSDMPNYCKLIGFLNTKKQEKAEAVVSHPKYDSPAYGKAVPAEEVIFTGEMVDMYDIVNSETGRFMANGLVTHNTSADMTKIAMISIADYILEHDMPAMIVNCVHDEIVTECREDIADDMAKVVKRLMIEAGEVMVKTVPIDVDVNISDMWAKH